MFFLEIKNSNVAGEIWFPIEGYEGLYEVSTYGRVRSLNYRGTGETKILKAVNNGTGYLHVSLCKDGKIKKFLVHRLVAQAFLYCKDRNSLDINHKDENPANNRVENIEYCDRVYNCNFGTRNQRVAEKLRNHPNKSKPVKQMSLDGELVRTWPSTIEAERNGFHAGNIVSCCNGKRKTHGGFKWAYA